MKYDDIKNLPEEGFCNLCQKTKPVGEMIVVYLRREKLYYLRPRCKKCHNERERGTRREWKRSYLQKWRKNNAKLNESYWKDNPVVREQARINAAKRFNEKHEAILIQGRLNRRGMNVSIKEAEELLEKYGRCYPSNFGLTKKGLRECERIRSRFRVRGKKPPSNFDIRLMVYEDGFFIEPALQPIPYQAASKTLRKWQRRQNSIKRARDSFGNKEFVRSQ